MHGHLNAKLSNIFVIAKCFIDLCVKQISKYIYNEINFFPAHVKEAHSGSRFIAPLILILSTRRTMKYQL
jgi:hypothetical protein